MKRFWKKPDLQGLDEMEKAILFKAQRNAYFFLVAALLLLSLNRSIRVYRYHERLDPLPALLLAAAVLIQTFSQLLMTRNAVKDDEESFETAPLIRIIFFLCVVTVIIATAGAAILLTGVKA
ncbi:MAG: hypothetical protein HDT26_06515 [Subdoligranulum sp.]|nr:hypothetical protein [Subdoligranulum sp.]